jgi:hypothetical protein
VKGGSTKEDLKTLRFENGDVIPNVENYFDLQFNTIG